MSPLWEHAVEADPRLRTWISARAGELEVARLPRPAWPIGTSPHSPALKGWPTPQ